MQPPYASGCVPLDLSSTSPNAPSTVAMTPILGLGRFDAIVVDAALVGATGGTLDVYLQVSYDWNPYLQTGLFIDYIHFSQLAGGASALRWHSDPANTNSITLVGSGLTPALAANSVAGGYWVEAMRVLYVAGAGTTLGAAQTITLIGKQRTVRP